MRTWAKSDSLFPFMTKYTDGIIWEQDFKGGISLFFWPHHAAWDLSSQAQAPAVEAQYPKPLDLPGEFQREDSRALGGSSGQKSWELWSWQRSWPLSLKSPLFSPPPNTLAPSQRIWWRAQEGITPWKFKEPLLKWHSWAPIFKNTSMHFVPLVLTGHYQCDEVKQAHFTQRQKKPKIESLGPAVGHDPNLKVQLPPSFSSLDFGWSQIQIPVKSAYVIYWKCVLLIVHISGFRHWDNFLLQNNQ